MTEFDRLDGCIEWIDLSFVKRERTPRWAIEVGIRCHISGMSLRETSKFLGELGIDRSHVAIHNWVHKAELQPASTVSANQLAVDEKMIRLHGQQFWLYAAVDPVTNEIVAVSLFPTTNKVTTRWFLDDLTSAAGSLTSRFSSTVLIILSRYSRRMATTTSTCHTGTVTLSNVCSVR
jgi:transposase-like protein